MNTRSDNVSMWIAPLETSVAVRLSSDMLTMKNKCFFACACAYGGIDDVYCLVLTVECN
jgi:hypothetical protein